MDTVRGIGGVFYMNRYPHLTLPGPAGRQNRAATPQE
jgi:hypothetical protein